MSASEWQLCYSLSFAWLDRGELADIPIEEQFRAIIHRLAHDYGYEFDGLKLGDDLDIYAKRKDILTPGVVNWVVMMVVGMVPDYLTHADAAIRFCEQNPRLSFLCPTLREYRQRVALRLEREPEPSEEEKVMLRESAKLDRRAVAAAQEVLH
jgi:hypothetical protein